MEVGNMLIYPHYSISFTFNHFIDYVRAYQAQVYHAVMIRLSTKQYYLFVYIFWSSRRGCRQVDHRYVIDFSKHINSETTNALEYCCA